VSPRSSTRSGGPYRKPRFDLYTWLLFLSFVAIVIACVCLFLEVKDYGDKPYELSLSAPFARECPVMVAGALGPQGPSEPDLPPCWTESIHG